MLGHDGRHGECFYLVIGCQGFSVSFADWVEEPQSSSLSARYCRSEDLNLRYQLGSGSLLLFRHYFLFLPPRAVLSAMATACFWGLPAAISVLMLDETAALDLPLLNGIWNLHGNEYVCVFTEEAVLLFGGDPRCAWMVQHCSTYGGVQVSAAIQSLSVRHLPAASFSKANWQ
jgi:hypothetical protein